MKEIHVVTGAFGYSGKYIAKGLIEAGHEVRTLTNSQKRPNPFGNQVKSFPMAFDEPHWLRSALEGSSVLYNTYWVRFNHRTFNHSVAVDNTLRLFQAAKESGVKRIVHVSITNPSEDSPLEYFQGKAILEKALIESGLSYSILRPTVIFGQEDILINNIAWILRTFPVFAVFGDGKYKLQPIYVEDLAQLAVEQGQEQQNNIINAIGPETFTYRELAKTIGEIIGKKRPIISVPDTLGYWLGCILGKMLGDVIVTREEIKGLKSNLIYVDAPPVGKTKLTEWAKWNADSLGYKYSSELARRSHRDKSYKDL